MGNFKDLTGQRFGELIVLGLSHCTLKWRHLIWLCRCDCGAEITVPGGNLTGGNTKRCINCRSLKQVKDITGQRFGRLLVLRAAYKGSNNSWFWECKCDCGEEVTVDGHSLRSGNTKSCGCYNKERVAETGTIHGMSKSKIKYVHTNMKQRCFNSNNPEYHNYGGRGIKICDRWLGKEGFIHFMEDMGTCPAEGLSIDRIDNNGNYSPENCRWATQKEQQSNKRQNVLIERNGQIKVLSAWAKDLNISPTALSSRIKKWGIEKAFILPRNAMPYNKARREDELITFNGKTLSLVGWSEEIGTPLRTLKDRLFKKHWSIERTLTEPMHYNMVR